MHHLALNNCNTNSRIQKYQLQEYKNANYKNTKISITQIQKILGDTKQALHSSAPSLPKIFSMAKYTYNCLENTKIQKYKKTKVHRYNIQEYKNTKVHRYNIKE